MEEQRAKAILSGMDGEEVVSSELINSVKSGMMGPLAGVGDTLNYATIKPVLTSFFMGFAQKGYIWAPIVFDVLLYCILVGEGWFMYNAGYKLGAKSATSIMKNNSVQKIITFFSVLGLCVMGVMAAENVSVAFAVNIPFATETLSLQSTLIDPIAPGLLPLAAVFAIYAYLKKGGNNLKATLWMLAIAAVFGGLGILG
jgi:PTS system mannose-specific IID component